MKTYTLELTRLELGMLSAVADIARHHIELADDHGDQAERLAQLRPLFDKIRETSHSAYREERNENC